MRFSLVYFLAFLLLSSCDHFSEPMFKKLSPSRTGIDFTNVLVENDTLNYTKFPYMYMGGGISVGDINNDGLDDIFLTGNLVPNCLYMNKGNMRFEDISDKAGIMGNRQWFTGSTMADVNNDGWLDIYVCVSAKYQPSDNLLFINNKDNTFTESAKSYGINDRSSSVQATFFDYNNDGLLDLYVANYPIVLVSMGAEFYNEKMNVNKYEESGHLYRNNGNNTFTDVTDEAGVRNFGMSIGVVAMDFNNDGWKDLYISNDFNPPDYFYLNNGDGTFREILKKATFQTSIFGMGLDAADINNDGLLDMYQIDMTPPDHYRRMVNVIPMRQETFYKSLDFGFHYQYMQNSLQLNNGVFDSIPVFSNISLFAGVAYTDWSWGGLFMDMDNDGNQDLFVTNGVLKDINNQDILANPRSSSYFNTKPKEYRPELFPSTPVRNFAFRNNGDLTFSNKAELWGFDGLTLTNGVSYGDFDNDGDLDLVVHNVNEHSAIYVNKVVSKDNHFLKIRLNGPVNNPFGVGSIVLVHTNDITQKQELTLTRGYQSSVPPVFHFGLGAHAVIDMLTIVWPDGKKQVLNNLEADKTLVLNYSDALMADSENTEVRKMFKDITLQSGISFIHQEDDYDDFRYEPLLPYKISHIGPGLAVGDMNNDGLEDFFIGNGAGSASALFIQSPHGNFKEFRGPWTKDTLYDITGSVIFDANGDGNNDLLTVTGGNGRGGKKVLHSPKLYLNTGSGFVYHESSIPSGINVNSKCIIPSDYDKDGDMDIFIGGRMVPGNYPYPANSYILRNNGKKGDLARFENVTDEIAPVLQNVGLVTDAVWDDFDQDGDLDLIITGEWMNIRFLENTQKGFKEVTDKLGFGQSVGWWTSINIADIDRDGDNDYLVGNLGLNYRYKASEKQPFEIYANDFDVNGQTDIVLSHTEDGISYPAISFDATVRQIPVIMHRYNTYDDFAKASLKEIYGEKMLEASLHYRISTFANSWIENSGNGEFVLHMLPNPAQLSSINDMAEIKYGNDSTFFLVAGNLYNSEVETPRNDASIGLLLEPQVGEGLKAIPPAESGVFIKGEVKAMKTIRLASGKSGLLVAFNNDALKLFEL